MNVSASPGARPGLFFAGVLTNRRKLTIGLSVVLMAVLLTVVGRGQLALMATSRGPSVGPIPATTVQVVTLREEVVAVGLRYSALVKELRRVELSFRVPGTVEKLLQVTGPGGQVRNVHEGDQLLKDLVIAELDTEDYERERKMATERLAEAGARVKQAEAAAELAEIDYRRAEQLGQRNAASTSEVDTIRARLRNTTAQEQVDRRSLELARLALEQAEANLRHCKLTVPFESASVARRQIEVNERVLANQQAFSLIDVSSVTVAFHVPDTLVCLLMMGQSMDVSCEAIPGASFVGKIHKIGSSADPLTRTYPVEIRIDQPGGLRPGMVATAHLSRDRSAYLLPLTAIAPGRSSHARMAYRVVEESGELVVREISVRLDGILDNRAAIRLGPGEMMAPGDRIVATGVHRLYDGQSVRIAD